MPTCEIHAIPGADIDAHFTHPAADRSNISQIPKTGRIQAGKDAGLRTHVAQRTKPFAEDVRLSELVHQLIVSVWLHSVNASDDSDS